MYRTAASRLRALKGHAGNRSITRFASSSAVATKSSSSGGFFSWLTGLGSSSLPPLLVPLQGVTIPPPLPDYVEPDEVKITTLPNGVKIASEPSANPAASIGLYVDCGSIYETPVSFGATHLLERMAFKSTTEGVTFALSGKWKKLVVMWPPQLLGSRWDTPLMLSRFMLQKVKAEIAEASNNPQGLLLEAIHSAGYYGALANPLLAPESAVNSLDCRILEEFVAENYTACRMVLAASGVEHEELLKIAEPLLSDLPSIRRPEEPKSVYVGGDYRCQADSGKTHFALAFEAPGGWHKEKEAMVLTMLMGGGGSFSAGVLEKGCTHGYSSDFVSNAIDIAVKELIAVATPGEVDQVQLDRAKQSTKSAILMNLESRMIVSEDIGRQVLTYGERIPVEHFLKVVDEVSAKDIASVARKLISSPLTMASYGDVIYVPSYDTVSSKFHSK
ncbi:Mitochondrial-processing peptidase subunit alpha [Camellia lanceoleosa]|uniref:Mitochondrial-processing peptidase subunit alpha n=1 Tax=Camellia lanceoleosa TaxID=1840588 RepID=A0ACC0FFD3_9ERIC|nr:Mitochondrial-processing peptidase subunit alpha [Camellia lanceoleosa]